MSRIGGHWRRGLGNRVGSSGDQGGKSRLAGGARRRVCLRHPSQQGKPPAARGVTDFQSNLRYEEDIPGDADLWLWVVSHTVSPLIAFAAASSERPDCRCAKGVEADTHLLPLEVVSDVYPDRPLAVLTGPNFAHEVAKGLPAAAVVASTDAGLRERVLAITRDPDFQVVRQ